MICKYSNFASSVAVMLISTYGCTSGSDDSIFSSVGNQQSKPRVTQIQEDDGSQLNAIKAPTEIASVTYDVFVFAQARYDEYQEALKTDSKAVPETLCIGEASTTIMSDISLGKFTVSMDCMGVKLDDLNLSGMLGGTSASSFLRLEKLAARDKMIWTSAIGNVDFAPERPLLIGPLIQDPASYLGYYRSAESTATHTDPTSHKVTTAKGRFDVRVHSARNSKGEEVVLKKYERNGEQAIKFDKVMNWSIAASGFEGLPVTQTLAFKKIEYFWNTNPIMIPMIAVSGNLSEFIKLSDNLGDVASKLVGELRIELQVKKYRL